jgi:hypothetical protein
MDEMIKALNAALGPKNPPENPPKDPNEPLLITGLPASVVGEWIPNSRTALARVTYNMVSLPEIWVVSVEFEALKSGQLGNEDKVWQHIYGRRTTSQAMDELLDLVFSGVKNIVAVNRQTPHNHIDVIFSSGGVEKKAKYGIMPQYVNLEETKHGFGEKAKPMRAHIINVLEFTGRDTKDLRNHIYRQSVSTIVQSRLFTSPVPGLDRTVCRDEMAEFPVFEETGTRVDPTLANASGTKGEETLKNFRERGVRLRSSVTVDAFKDSRLLHVHFDAVIAFPGLKNLAEIFRHIFRNNLEGDMSMYLEDTREMFLNLWVKRVHVPNDDAKWTRPFQIKNIVSDGNVNHLTSDGDTVYQYFEERYKQVTNPAFPLISDGVPDTDPPIPGQRKSWFPMEALELAFEQPVNNGPMTRGLKIQIDESHILKQSVEDAKALFEGYAKALVETIAKPRTPETLELLKVELDNPVLKRVDAIGHRNLDHVQAEAKKKTAKRDRIKRAKAKKRALAAWHSTLAPSTS